MLLGLAVFAYSAAWTVIVVRVARSVGDDFFTVITEAAVATALFALLLVAMRFGFLVEEGIACRNRTMRYAVRLSIVAALAAAMLPYYLRP